LFRPIVAIVPLSKIAKCCQLLTLQAGKNVLRGMPAHLHRDWGESRQWLTGLVF